MFHIQLLASNVKKHLDQDMNRLINPIIQFSLSQEELSFRLVAQQGQTQMEVQEHLLQNIWIVSNTDNGYIISTTESMKGCHVEKKQT